MTDYFDSSILFVDDEADITTMLEETFNTIVSTIYTANRADKALEIVKKNKINVAVLDIKMPDKDGLELMQEIKEIHPEVVFIFLTGYGNKASIQSALRLGAENFIDKPFDIPYLMLSIKRALEKASYESMLREMLELFILSYTKLDVSNFAKLGLEEKEKALQAALGVARLKIMKKKSADSGQA